MSKNTRQADEPLERHVNKPLSTMGDWLVGIDEKSLILKRSETADKRQRCSSKDQKRSTPKKKNCNFGEAGKYPRVTKSDRKREHSQPTHWTVYADAG